MFLPEEKIKAHIHMEDKHDHRQEMGPQCLRGKLAGKSQGKEATA